MAAATATQPTADAFGVIRRHRALAAATALVVLFVVLRLSPWDTQVFPVAWNLHLRQPIDAFRYWVIGNRNTHWLFAYLFDPLSSVVDWWIRGVENFLLALPWPLLVLGMALLGHRLSGWKGASLAGIGFMLMGLLGLWSQSMQTLALIMVSVLISLVIGIPLGIWAARNRRVDTLLRPILDAMQTLPAFVYLIPVLLFFGIARVPAAIATVIYALPPAIRLTSLGIRQVPAEAVEAARSFGSTNGQTLIKVQIPLAMPTIMAGVNQTLMMALGIVVIAALIGAGGLGREVLVGLQRLKVGQAFEAGLAIVIMAIVLDRLSFALTQVGPDRPKRFGETRWRRLTRSFPPFMQRHGHLLAGVILIAGLFAFDAIVVDLRTFPPSWRLPVAAPTDALVRWSRDHLYNIGNTGLGTGPLSDFITIYGANPLRRLFQDWLPWPVVIAGMAAIAWLVSGWRLAAGAAMGMFGIGLLNMWPPAMDTLSQVLVAVAFSVVIGVPLGILSAKNDRFEFVLRPFLDFLQTIPPFVYLVPVIMLFNVGRVPGIIASVLYALPPVIRLTNLGIRRVEGETIEAATAFGSTRAQTLTKVELPLAMPSIMAGVNQTVMMVLSMVIIAGLVGGAGLGLESVIGLAKNETGRGVEAGLTIVILAMILDRITQAWAKRFQAVEKH